MQVYRDLNIAKNDMVSLSRKLHQNIYLTYTKYGNNPTCLEYCLRTKEEMVNIYKFTTCIAIYHVGDGMLDILTKNDLLRYFPDLIEAIQSSHRCGDEPLRGSTNSLEELPFKNNNYE